MSKNFKKIRTGVIGTGAMGQHHARIYSEISNLVGVSDLDENQGRSVADKYGVPWYKDYNELIKKVDAVTIAVPTSFHLEIASKFCSSGKHILVEKPLAGSLTEAEAIVSIAEENKVILAVGHIERFNPVIKYAKKQIESNTWGDLISITSKRLSTYPERINDVGVIFDIGIHDLDALTYLTGSKVSHLSSVSSKTNNLDFEDSAFIILKYENGVNGSIHTSWLNNARERVMKLNFTRAVVKLDFISQKVSLVESSDLDNTDKHIWNSNLNTHVKSVAIKKFEPLKEEVRDFLEAVSTSSKPLVSGEDGAYNVKLAEWALSPMD